MKNIIDRKYVSLFLCSCTYPLLICHWRKRKGERKFLTCFLKFIKSGLYYNANQISGNNWKKKSPTAANTIKLYTSVIALLSPVLQSLIDFIKKLYPLYKKNNLYVLSLALLVFAANILPNDNVHNYRHILSFLSLQFPSLFSSS